MRFRGSQGAVAARKKQCCCCAAAEKALREARRPVVVGQHVFVDPINGNDTTGQRNAINRPFRTIPSALLVAQEGDTIALQPGRYLIAATIDLPNLAHLFIEGWGGPQNVTLVKNTPGPIFRMTNPAQTNQQLWGISGIFFTTDDDLSGATALEIGDAASDRFPDALLINNCALFTFGGIDVLFTRLGQAIVTNSFMFTLGVIGCSSFQANDCLIISQNLSFADATNSNFAPSGGRNGYFFASCQSFFINAEGAPVITHDEGCTTNIYQGNLSPSALLGGINPAISYAGIAGGNQNENSNGNITAAVTMNLTFANQAWFTGGGSVLNGVNLSGMRNYGRTLLQFNANLPTPLDPTQFLFGGDNASLFGGLQVTAPVPGVGSARYLCKFRSGSFGTVSPTPAIETNQADIDIRSCKADGALSVTGPAGHGIDRDSALVQKAFPLVAGANVGFFSIPTPFPSYVGSDLTPLLTPSLSGVSAGATATPTSVPYDITAAGGETIDVLVLRHAP